MNRSGPPSQLDSPSTPASPLLGYFCCIAVSAPSPLMCNDQLIQLVGADRFFDSRDMQMDRARDGLHPTMKGAVVWMEQLATWMQSELTRHPVILNTPQQKSTIQNLTVMQTKDKGFY